MLDIALSESGRIPDGFVEFSGVCETICLADVHQVVVLDIPFSEASFWTDLTKFWMILDIQKFWSGLQIHT